MAVHYVDKGGGLWDSIIPKVFSLGGMALGGPIGGLVGNFAGNLASGQSVGQAAGNTAVGAANQYITPIGGTPAWDEEMSRWRNGGNR